MTHQGLRAGTTLDSSCNKDREAAASLPSAWEYGKMAAHLLARHLPRAGVLCAAGHNTLSLVHLVLINDQMCGPLHMDSPGVANNAYRADIVSGLRTNLPMHYDLVATNPPSWLVADCRLYLTISPPCHSELIGGGC